MDSGLIIYIFFIFSFLLGACNLIVAGVMSYFLPSLNKNFLKVFGYGFAGGMIGLMMIYFILITNMQSNDLLAITIVGLCNVGGVSLAIKKIRGPRRLD